MSRRTGSRLRRTRRVCDFAGLEGEGMLIVYLQRSDRDWRMQSSIIREIGIVLLVSPQVCLHIMINRTQLIVSRTPRSRKSKSTSEGRGTSRRQLDVRGRGGASCSIGRHKLDERLHRDGVGRYPGV